MKKLNLKGNIIAIDTETTGLDPYFEKNYPFMFIWYTNLGERGYLFSDDANFIPFIQEIFYDSSKEIVAHHLKFDLSMLVANGIIDLYKLYKTGAKLHCTKVQSVLIDNLGSHSLESLTERYLQLTGGKDTCKLWLKNNTRQFTKEFGYKPCYIDIPKSILIPYALQDAEWCLKLHYTFKEPMKKFALLYRNEINLLFVDIDMEMTGVCVNLKKTKELAEQSKLSILLLKALITKLIGANININSSLQLKKLLYITLGFTPHHLTKKNQPSTDEYALISLLSKEVAGLCIIYDGKTIYEYINFAINQEQKYALLLLVLKYKELSKLYGTYYTNLLLLTKRDNDKSICGTMHCIFNSLGAKTGRYSSGGLSGINLQNIPQGNGPRECITARKGYINAHIDYNQIELKLGAHYSNDDKLIDAMRMGKDIHQLTAELIFKKIDINEKERRIAKTVNFGIWYGIGSATLSQKLTKEKIPVSVSEAKRFIRQYFIAYPQVRQVMKQDQNDIMTKGFVINEFGRENKVDTELSYKSTNFRIQGCAADIMKMALVRCWQMILEKKLNVKILGTIHDEIIFQIPEDKYKKIIPLLTALMEDFPQFKVPMKTETNFYNNKKSWANKKESIFVSNQ